MKYFLIMLLAVVVGGCVSTPTQPAENKQQLEPGGLFVLCQGVWGNDNSQLDYINPDGTVVSNLLENAGGEAKLGDTSNDIKRYGNKLLVAMTASRVVAEIDATTGALIRTAPAPLALEPTKMILHGKRLFVSNRNDDSFTEYDVETLRPVFDRIVVGPAPEGITVKGGHIYVAISGLGDLRKREPNAGTVAIVSATDFKEVARITNLPNAGDVVAHPSENKVFCSYRAYPADWDSRGGVACVNSLTHTEEWRVAFDNVYDMSFDSTNNVLWVLHPRGFDYVSMDGTRTKVVDMRNGIGNWFSIHFDNTSGEIVLGDANSYINDGDVIRFSRTGEMLSKTKVGINPVAFTR